MAARRGAPGWGRGGARRGGRGDGGRGEGGLSLWPVVLVYHGRQSFCRGLCNTHIPTPDHHEGYRARRPPRRRRRRRHPPPRRTAHRKCLGLAEHRPRGMSLFTAHSRRKPASQSAPTLLLTTVSLLFTGELLDHVSVSTPRTAHRRAPTPGSAGKPCGPLASSSS